MRTTYDIVTAYRQVPRPVRVSRPYSRYATSLLEFFVQHRTALAAHVQRVFPTVFRTDRATRMHLQTLVARKELGILRGLGTAQPNAYVLTERGLRAYRDRTATNGVAHTPHRRRRPSGGHVLHELLVTEAAIAVMEAVRLRPDLRLLWEERFGFVGQAAFRSLIPDYGFLLGHAQGRLVCLVEVSSGEESPVRLGEKLTAYGAWAASTDAQEFLMDLYRTHGAQSPRPQFRLLFIVQDRRLGHDETRLRQLLRASSALSRDMRHRLWATTVTELAASRSFDAPIWVRAKHIDLAATTAKRPVLNALPRHRLFPSSVEGSSHVAPLADHPDRVGLSARG
jgi:protein involved in plasmid replication-relaxation